MKHPGILVAVMLLSLSACQKPGQSTYKASELGVSRSVEFGTIIDVREVEVVADSTNSTGSIPGGMGTLGGGGIGALAGNSFGAGTGNIWSDVGGAVAGAVAGTYIEQELRHSTGYQYILTLRNGETKTITLEKVEGDEVFKPGDKVMLQYCDTGEHKKRCKSGEEYQRLIKVDKFPPRPHDATKHHWHHDDDRDDDDDKDDEKK